MKKTNKDELNNICSVEDFAKAYPHLNFTRHRFNYLIRTQDKNGILKEGVIVKDGRGYKVKLVEFGQWYYRHINIYGREA